MKNLILLIVVSVFGSCSAFGESRNDSVGTLLIWKPEKPGIIFGDKDCINLDKHGNKLATLETCKNLCESDPKCNALNYFGLELKKCQRRMCPFDGAKASQLQHGAMSWTMTFKEVKEPGKCDGYKNKALCPFEDADITEFIDKFGGPAKFGGWRTGEPKETVSCNTVTGLPSDVKRFCKPYWYKKYTEAYGIPIVASGAVSNEALTRACKIMAFLFADRKDTRRMMYKNYGRFAVIGFREFTTNIPGHSNLASWWNQRARGLGAMVGVPVSTGGEENLMCFKKGREPYGDRYGGYEDRNGRWTGDDIYFHESAHAVAELAIRSGAVGGMSFYNGKLNRQYLYAKGRRMWERTYSMSTVREYFAEGAQSFFDCHVEGTQPTNGIHGTVNTKKELLEYDPALYNLLKVVFPCENTYISCPSRATYGQNFRINCENGVGKKLGSDGPCKDENRLNVKEDEKRDTRATCGGGGEEKPNPTPNPNPKECKDLDTSCESWSKSGYCTKDYVKHMRENCQKSCNFCKTEPKPTPPKPTPPPLPCEDKHSDCVGWASDGYCTNREYEAYFEENCRKSCNFCPKPKPKPTKKPTPKPNPACDNKESDQKCEGWKEYCTNDGYKNWMKENCCKTCHGGGGANCKDGNTSCAKWARRGECSRNPEWMHPNCKKSCNKC